MADMTWPAAIQKVLSASPTPLYYKQITERILEQGLRKKVGATRGLRETLRSRRQSSATAKTLPIDGWTKAHMN